MVSINLCYSVSFARSARKELESLDNAIALRILRKIESLPENPRPAGCKKLSGQKSLSRIRIGDYRIVYSIDDINRLIDITIIRHRSSVYNNLDGDSNSIGSKSKISKRHLVKLRNALATVFYIENSTPREIEQTSKGIFAKEGAFIVDSIVKWMRSAQKITLKAKRIKNIQDLMEVSTMWETAVRKHEGNYGKRNDAGQAEHSYGSTFNQILKIRCNEKKDKISPQFNKTGYCIANYSFCPEQRRCAEMPGLIVGIVKELNMKATWI